jgi:hypothetical protein
MMVTALLMAMMIYPSFYKRNSLEIFEKEVVVYPTASGTAANALALSALTPVYGNIYCHKLSHINTDECGAPEFYTGGGKLVTLMVLMEKLHLKNYLKVLDWYWHWYIILNLCSEHYSIM